MLHWKNKPINSLSKSELQQALQDSIPLVMGKHNVDVANGKFSAFITGMFAGLLLAGASIAFAAFAF